MAEQDDTSKRKNKPCPGCGGSGQVSYFYGESKFMLTWEDCQDCCGTGVVLEDAEREESGDD